MPDSLKLLLIKHFFYIEQKQYFVPPHFKTNKNTNLNIPVDLDQVPWWILNMAIQVENVSNIINAQGSELQTDLHPVQWSLF